MSKLAEQLAFVRAGLNRLSPIPDEAWFSIKPLFKYRTTNAGEHLIQAGENVKELYFLTSGLARLYYCDAEGKEYNKSFALPGEVISSLSSLVNGCPSPYHVQAMWPSESMNLDYDEFVELAERHPAWRLLQIRILEQLVIIKEQREADFLQLSATERYAKFLREYAYLADRIPNYHIAAYLGMTEVALSRIRKKLGLTRANNARKC